MRNKRNYTKSTVRLRKSEYRDEWHVYIESYPVMVEGKDKPQRIRKYINRSVKTVVFDKKRTSRTTSEKTTYKPKRDDNGIIICKSYMLIVSEKLFNKDLMRESLIRN